VNVFEKQVCQPWRPGEREQAPHSDHILRDDPGGLRNCPTHIARIVDTEMNAIREGKIALEHAKNRSTESAKRAGRTQVGMIAVMALARSGQRWLSDVGRWNGNSFELDRYEPWYQRVQSLATGQAFENWSADVKLEDLAQGRPELTYTKEGQLQRATSRVYDIVTQAPAREHGYNPPQDWAFDGSMVG
jgi:hypothetical protein